MGERILYLGDTALDQQASYLAGILTHFGFDFDYIASDTKYSDSHHAGDYKLMIISDYPSCNFTEDQMHAIASKVKAGMSLLMIGGWESFIGLEGDYGHTPIEDLLPVTMKASDDRMNFSSPCMVMAEQSHEIIDALPFDSDVPAIGGMNSFTPKAGADVLLSAVQFKAAIKNGEMTFTESGKHPLLVIHEDDSSRVAAFASDVAPHWVGPLVDWGDSRIKAQAKGADSVEVGSWYGQFFANLINWLTQL